MCLLAIFFRALDGVPLAVGANREEAYARVGEPPQRLEGPLQAVGGRDPVAGGTWLGVNESGVLVAVTNRPKSQTPQQPRSRGLLVRELLACPTAAAAVDRASRELNANRYAGCNLVCADAESLVVLHAGDWLRVRPLPAGLHVLTAHDVNDESDPRIDHARSWLMERHPPTASDCIDALKQLCRQSGNGGPPICLHGEDRGTVSSSILALPPDLSRGRYWHAQGPPDQTAYEDYSYLLREMARAPLSRKRHHLIFLMYPHRIRLRGPWECEPLARAEGADMPLPPPCRMTMPCRWSAGGLAEFAGRVRSCAALAFQVASIPTIASG